MNILDKYSYTPTEIIDKVKEIKSNSFKWEKKEIYSNILGMIDLTSLTVSDTPSKIAKMTEKVCNFNTVYPNIPIPASICVYPNLAQTIAERRGNCPFNITVVGGCFPASQSFLEVKIAECVKAVESGADEVDIVLAHSLFNEQNYDAVAEEIKQIGEAIRKINKDVILKVILETGALANHTEIAIASFIAMEAGADFIKTSTGKTEPAATPEAAYIMCECIKAFYKATNKKIGFKPAGGMVSAQDGALYYGIVDSVLGTEWLNKNLLRFGASRMANNLLTEILNEPIKYY